MPAKRDCIVRIYCPAKRTYGYQGRVHWGKTYSRFYAARKSGGWKAARAKALRWVLRTERQLGKPRSSHYVYRK